jgi:hypothetical protein
MVPWLVAACLHTVKRLLAQGRKQLNCACARSRAWSQMFERAIITISVEGAEATDSPRSPRCWPPITRQRGLV